MGQKSRRKRRLLSPAPTTAADTSPSAESGQWRAVLALCVGLVLFAIHPLRVESVAWVAERKDLLSGLFFLLTLPVEMLPMAWRIANALVASVSYLGQFFYPAGLAVFYPHPAQSLPLWKIAAARLVLTAVTAAAVIWLRRRPDLAVGWFECGQYDAAIGHYQEALRLKSDFVEPCSNIGDALMLQGKTAAEVRIALMNGFFPHILNR